MRTDPDPDGSKLDLLGQYLDYQRKTILLGTTGSAASSLAKALAPEDPRRAALPPGTGGEAAARYGWTVKPASK
jgi:hypothetical protein